MVELRPNQVLDTKGLLCPMPVIKTKLIMEEMAPGQILKVLATDPAAPGDFAVWCKETGNKLLQSAQEKRVYTFLIQKTGG